MSSPNEEVIKQNDFDFDSFDPYFSPKALSNQVSPTTSGNQSPTLNSSSNNLSDDIFGILSTSSTTNNIDSNSINTSKENKPDAFDDFNSWPNLTNTTFNISNNNNDIDFSNNNNSSSLSNKEDSSFGDFGEFKIEQPITTQSNSQNISFDFNNNNNGDENSVFGDFGEFKKEQPITSQPIENHNDNDKKEEEFSFNHNQSLKSSDNSKDIVREDDSFKVEYTSSSTQQNSSFEITDTTTTNTLINNDHEDEFGEFGEFDISQTQQIYLESHNNTKSPTVTTDNLSNSKDNISPLKNDNDNDDNFKVETNTQNSFDFGYPKTSIVTNANILPINNDNDNDDSFGDFNHTSVSPPPQPQEQHTSEFDVVSANNSPILSISNNKIGEFKVVTNIQEPLSEDSFGEFKVETLENNTANNKGFDDFNTDIKEDDNIDFSEFNGTVENMNNNSFDEFEYKSPKEEEKFDDIDFTSSQIVVKNEDNDSFGDFDTNNNNSNNLDDSQSDYTQPSVIVESSLLSTQEIDNDNDNILYNNSSNNDNNSNSTSSKSKPIQFTQSPHTSRKSPPNFNEIGNNNEDDNIENDEDQLNQETSTTSNTDTNNIIMPSINSENLQTSQSGTPKIPFSFTDNITDSNDQENKIDEFGDFGEFNDTDEIIIINNKEFNQQEEEDEEDKIQQEEELEKVKNLVFSPPQPTNNSFNEDFNEEFNDFKESNTDDFGDFGDFNEGITNQNDNEFGEFDEFGGDSSTIVQNTTTTSIPSKITTPNLKNDDEFGDFGDFGDSSFPQPPPSTSTTSSPPITSNTISNISDLKDNITKLLNQENTFIQTLSQFKEANKSQIQKNKEHQQKTILDLLKISEIDRQIYMQPTFSTTLPTDSPLILKETEIEKQFLQSMNFTNEILSMVKKFEHERVNQPLKPISTTVYIPSSYNHPNLNNTNSSNNNSSTLAPPTISSITPPVVTANTPPSFEFVDAQQTPVKPINLGNSDASTLLGFENLPIGKVNPFDQVMSKIPDLSFMLANTLKIPAKVNHRIPTAKFKLDQTK